MSFADQGYLSSEFREMMHHSIKVGMYKPTSVRNGIISSEGYANCQGPALFDGNLITVAHYPNFNEDYFERFIEDFLENYGRLEIAEFVLISGALNHHDKWREAMLGLGCRPRAEFTDDFQADRQRCTIKSVVLSEKIGILKFGKEYTRLY